MKLLEAAVDEEAQFVNCLGVTISLWIDFHDSWTHL